MMNILRRPIFKTDNLSFEVQVELPTNGTYPPRVVFPHFSIWVRKDKFVSIEPGLFVHQEQDRCYLSIEPLRFKGVVEVNGHNVADRCELKDGDFLVFDEQNKAVFQSDPVADFREDSDSFDQTHEKSYSDIKRGFTCWQKFTLG
jgi:hypothetical protein